MYEMKPEYYIGIDMIDEEHKQLFKYADVCCLSLFIKRIKGIQIIRSTANC